MSKEIQQILAEAKPKEIRSLFAFNRKNTDEEVLFKFNLWARKFFPGYFMDVTKTKVIDDAPFHEHADLSTIRVYRGSQPVFIDIGFRGAAKTTRKKLMFGFMVGNDLDNYRRYMKLLSKDKSNSEQSSTDIYNMYVIPRVKFFYPEIFQKTPEKKVERMDEWETAKGIKIKAETVGTEQRGHVQDEFRPDVLWFDDFESRLTMRSAVTLQKIWDNMQEAIDGLPTDGSGGQIFTCNYISERGNVHKLIQKYPEYTSIIPIKGRVVVTISGGVLDVKHEDGPITWPGALTKVVVEAKLRNSEDPAGEYLCAPSAGADIYFERSVLDKMVKKEPVRDIAGFKIFHPYEPGHRYGSGHDVAGGLSLDHSTSVFIDFTQLPARVVATYKSNTIKPTAFGQEIMNQADKYGGPIVAVENNKFDTVISELRRLGYENLYVMMEKATKAGASSKVRQWGWNTNSMTKGTMMSALRKAVSDGYLDLSDPDLIAEMRAYTRDDLMDRDEDPRLATRHFDLLIACAIAWQMKDYAEIRGVETYQQAPYEPQSEYESSGYIPQTNIAPRPIMPEEMSRPYEQPAYEPMSEYES